jgi:hypothetical protein
MITNEVSFTKINGSEFAMLIFHENHVSSIANSEKKFINNTYDVLNFQILN